MGAQVELALLAVEAEGEPDLLLALPAAPGLGPAVAFGEVVGDPAVGAPEVG
jgi:hypothetical protein